MAAGKDELMLLLERQGDVIDAFAEAVRRDSYWASMWALWRIGRATNAIGRHLKRRNR